MADKKEEDHKWAVDTRNNDTGQVVRFIETKADWSAKIFVTEANETHKRLGRNHTTFATQLW